MTTTSAGVNYSYDGDGKRVEKNNGTLYWYGVSSDPLEETTLSGTLTNDYIFFGGQRIARRDASGNIFACLADHLGSSRKVEEIASGASSASLSYDADFYPFGRASEFVNTSDPAFKFTGKERDSEKSMELGTPSQRLFHGNRAGLDAIGERRPFDQFHHQRMSAAGVFEALDRGDVGVI
jgi:hypothetical protein